MEPLNDLERGEIVRKCSFAYMQEHRDAFEMNPPRLLQTDAQMFVRGTIDRHRDVPADMGSQILTWRVKDLRESGFNMDEIYPQNAAVW